MAIIRARARVVFFRGGCHYDLGGAIAGRVEHMFFSMTCVSDPQLRVVCVSLAQRMPRFASRFAAPPSAPPVSLSRRHQTCHFRKRATSVPAEGPAYGLDFGRHCEFPLRDLQGAEVACSPKSHVWCRPTCRGRCAAAAKPSPGERRLLSLARKRGTAKADRTKGYFL